MMRQKNRRRNQGIRRTAFLIAAAVLLSGLWPAAYQAEEIFSYLPEDRYLLVSEGNQYALYDQNGKERIRMGGYNEIPGAAMIRDDTFLDGVNDSQYILFSTRIMEPVVTFPMEGYQYRIGKEYALLAENETGLVRVYDLEGRLVSSFTPDIGKGAYGWGIELMDLTDSLFLCFSDYGTDDWEAFRMDKASGEVTRLSNPALEMDMKNGALLMPFGNHLVYADSWDAREAKVIDPDGSVLLDHVDRILSRQNAAGVFSYEYSSYWDNTVSYVEQVENGMRCVYGPELSVVGTYLPSGEEEEGLFSYCYEPYIVGMPYEELAGLPCTGYAQVSSEGMRPMAETEGGAYIRVYGETIFLPLEEGESIYQMNEAYYMTQVQNDGMPQNQIRRIDTGEVISRETDEEECYRYYGLGRTSLLIQDSIYTDEEYRTTSSIYDSTGKCTYTTEKGYLMPWYGDLWYLRRGIYTGICDQEGNWVFRTSSYEE